MSYKDIKQWQWGITLVIGFVLMVSSAGGIELGGSIAANFMLFIAGTVLAVWGLIKTNKWI